MDFDFSEELQTKRNYKNNIFNLIELGDYESLKKFFTAHPQLINKLYAPNHWSPM